MNLQQINKIRAEAGLAPLAGDPRKLEKERQRRANQAKHAEFCRELRSKRSGSTPRNKGK